MASYTATSGDFVIPGAKAATELLSPVGGFIAGCGEASLAVVANLINGTPIGPTEVTRIIHDAVAQGAGPGGTSTPSELAATGRTLGVTLQGQPYQSAISQYAGVKPIELGVSNASAFGGADVGVQGHYVTIVGRTRTGNLVVADPNQQASLTGGLVQYTPQQIQAAHPFWAGVPTQATAASAQGGISLPGLTPQQWGIAWQTALASVLGGGAAPAVLVQQGQQATQAATSIPQTIADGVTSLMTTLSVGAHLAGWLVLARVIMGAGLWLVIPEQVNGAVGAAGGAVKKVAKSAADAAALAA